MGLLLPPCDNPAEQLVMIYFVEKKLTYGPWCVKDLMVFEVTDRS
jgi:hypothetical protein